MADKLGFVFGCLMLSGCTPQPDKVCEHVIDLLGAELGARASVALPEEEAAVALANCTAGAASAKTAKGWLEYRAQASCVLAATSLDQLEACER